MKVSLESAIDVAVRVSEDYDANSQFHYTMHLEFFSQVQRIAGKGTCMRVCTLSEAGGCGPIAWYSPSTGELACDQHKAVLQKLKQIEGGGNDDWLPLGQENGTRSSPPATKHRDETHQQSTTPSKPESGKRYGIRVVYLFTTTNLDESAIAKLRSKVRERLPKGIRFPAEDRIAIRVVEPGQSKSHVSNTLQNQIHSIYGPISRSICVVTKGSDVSVEEGFLVGLTENEQHQKERDSDQFIGGLLEANAFKLSDLRYAGPGNGLAELALTSLCCILVVASIGMICMGMMHGFRPLVIAGLVIGTLAITGAWFAWTKATEKIAAAKRLAPLKRAHKAAMSRAAEENRWGGDQCPVCGSMALAKRVRVDSLRVGEFSASIEAEPVCIFCTPKECMIRECRERSTRVLTHNWSVGKLTVPNDLWVCDLHAYEVRHPRYLGGWSIVARQLGGTALVVGLLYQFFVDRPHPSTQFWMLITLYLGVILFLFGISFWAFSRYSQWSRPFALRKKPQYETTLTTNQRTYRDASFDF